MLRAPDLGAPVGLSTWTTNMIGPADVQVRGLQAENQSWVSFPTSGDIDNTEEAFGAFAASSVDEGSALGQGSLASRINVTFPDGSIAVGQSTEAVAGLAGYSQAAIGIGFDVQTGAIAIGANAEAASDPVFTSIVLGGGDAAFPARSGLRDVIIGIQARSSTVLISEAVIFGNFSLAGLRSVVVGPSIACDNDNVVVRGNGVSRDRIVAIGGGVGLTADDSVLVGLLASIPDGARTTQLGGGGVAGGLDSTFVGADTGVLPRAGADGGTTGVGYNAGGDNLDGSILLGRDATLSGIDDTTRVGDENVATLSDFGVVAAFGLMAQAISSPAAGKTGLSVMINDGVSTFLQTILIGAANSGPVAASRALYVP